MRFLATFLLTACVAIPLGVLTPSNASAGACKLCQVECRSSNPVKKGKCELKKSACFKTCF